MKTLHLLQLQAYPILDQLRLEEALVRVGTGNYCLINQGSPPAIVLGISGKMDRLVNLSLALKNKLPLIRRFSGGGTVVVDNNTLFITLIGDHETLDFPVFPHPLMEWTSRFYAPLLGSHFRLKENDYVLGDKKFGGNAQYLRKDRWLHHSSLLWDYQKEYMECLLFPEKVPSYREQRKHDEFLCKLKNSLSSPNAFVEGFKEELAKTFSLNTVSLGDVLPTLMKPHRQATRVLTPGDTKSLC